MSPTSLFPDPELPLTPAEREEPPLWVRRVVLAAEPSPAPMLLREPVELRPGLNIVRVAPRPAGETRRIGNSVGKTLLTRLIRYSLGEVHFGTAEKVRNVARLRPGACVLAEVRLGGTTWVKCRPLRDAPAGLSFAVRVDEWRSALAPDAAREPFSAFLDAVSAAMIEPLPAWRIPGEGRPPRWLDLLGWLARDQECRFLHPNEWRDPDARSGTGRLDREDASSLTAWVMGLLDTTEIREQQRRAEWHAERRNVEAEAHRLGRYLDGVRASLCQRLTVAESDLDDGLAEATVREVVARTRQEVEATRASAQYDDIGGELHDAAVSAAAAVRVAETKLDELDGYIGTTRDELRLCQGLPRPDYNARFNPYKDCPLERSECPHNPNCTNSAPDPEREARVATLLEHLARYNEQRNECNAGLPRLRAEAEAVRHRWQEEDRRRRQRLLDLGLADALADDYARYREARSRRDECLRRATDLQKRINDSLERRRAANSARERRLRQLSDIFDATMKELIGPDAGGVMALDARGLRPAPDATAGVSGAGLGTLAAVIGFDLACLAGGVAGIGSHPGFVLHDSPHTADLEDVLYERVFDWVRRLEELYGPRPVGFQYIVTTTTPPPKTCDRQPFVRLTLDARVESGMLLGARW